MKISPKKIILATGEYYPKIGGPAIYVYYLQKELKQKGFSPVVVTYGWEKKLPSGLRHIVFSLRLFFKSFGSLQIWAFDTYSVGLPTVCVAFLLRKHVLIRIGGDFLWEHYLNRTQEQIFLSEFYKKDVRLNLKERVIYKLTKYILSRTAHVVFSTRWQKDIWKSPYEIHDDKISVIDNAYTRAPIFADSTYGVFVSPARDSAVKNKKVLRDVMQEICSIYGGVSFDERGLSYEEHRERVASSYVVVVPSISEVSPNLLLDGLLCGKPFIATSDCGFREEFQNCGIFINPLNRDDLKTAVEDMLDTKQYEKYREQIRNTDLSRTYRDIVEDFIRITHV